MAKVYDIMNKLVNVKPTVKIKITNIKLIIQRIMLYIFNH